MLNSRLRLQPDAQPGLGTTMCEIYLCVLRKIIDVLSADLIDCLRLSSSYQPPQPQPPQPRPQPPQQPPPHPPPQPSPPQGPPPQKCSFLSPSGAFTAPGAASAGVTAERKAGWSAAETLAIAITAAMVSAEIFIILTIGCTCVRRSKLRYDALDSHLHRLLLLSKGRRSSTFDLAMFKNCTCSRALS